VTYGGDSANRIFVLYWRCPLIRVSVIRGSTVLSCRHGLSPYQISYASSWAAETLGARSPRLLAFVRWRPEFVSPQH
jgi:hypothetical protein